MVVLVVIDLVLAAIFDLDPASALFEAPSPALGLPAAGPAAGLRVLLRHHPVRRHVLVPVPGRRRHLLARRHQDPLHRRVGPGRRRSQQVQGEHRLPRGPRGHRGEGRLRARRHPAVGPARHRQDAHGRGRRRRDRQAVRVRRPRRVHPDVHGRRHPQGEGAVPEAAQAGPALRRRHRLLRRGRLARQPRPAGTRGRSAASGPRHPSSASRAGCNGLHYLSPESAWSQCCGVARRAAASSPDHRGGMGGMGGGGGMGTLQALLTELSGLKKPRGFLNRHGPPAARACGPSRRPSTGSS